MKLFIIHCGYYDEEVMDAIYEFHVNIPIAAESIEAAKVKIRQHPVFKKKKMHIDGIQEVQIISGFRLSLIREEKFTNATIIEDYQERDF